MSSVSIAWIIVSIPLLILYFIENNTMSFFKYFGKAKANAVVDDFKGLLVKWDPDTATEAAILEIESHYDKLNLELSKAKLVYEKEQAEADAIVKLHNQRLAAAEALSADPTKEKAALTLIAEIESMQPDVEREIEEAAEAKQDLEDLEALVNQVGEKLKSARKTVESAKKEMQRAEVAKEKAKNAEESAKIASGLSTGISGLSSALGHMQKAAEQAKAEADAAKAKAKLLTPTRIEEDPDIAAAMKAASGEQVGTSLADRLASLKKK